MASDMPERLFRCAGDVQFDDSAPAPGIFLDAALKSFSDTCNYLQYQRPLSKQQPCFFSKIHSLSTSGVVSVGIAGNDISDDTHPGRWHGTVGYHSNGDCYSSHQDGVNAGVDGGVEKYGEGDIVGVIVTYFGKKMSTVVFTKNGTPIATRYIFQDDHNQYFPTVAMENGPIQIGIMWAEAFQESAHFNEMKIENWIRDPSINYSGTDNILSAMNCTKSQVTAQSPLPFSKRSCHFEVVVHEVDTQGASGTIGMMTCSPLYPSPTCPLLGNNFHWHPDGNSVKMAAGGKMSWGICYDPSARDTEGFDDRREQLVMCYVTMNEAIVYTHMVLQPPGGWFPFVALHPYASKIELNIDVTYDSVSSENLDSMYRKLLPTAQCALRKDRLAREITMCDLRLKEGLAVEIGDVYTTISLPKNQKGIHVVQFRQPLAPKRNYFLLEIVHLGDSSVVCLGIAGSDLPLDRFPGKIKNTVGYFSRNGRMCYNGKDKGNMAGRRYGRGDVVGVEVEVFERKMSVALFSRNARPVGTRYLTQTDHTQFLPTVAICGNGAEVTVKVVWQNRVAEPPTFSVTDIGQWCLPEGARVDRSSDIVLVEAGHMEAETIQAPYSLHREYNHFEVELVDGFSETVPPPAIALCTASPFDPVPKSNFKQDFIRFWAMGEAQKAVEPGDLIGWGMLYPDDYTHHDAEQLVICYLTINRNVALTRVMYQPPGGFYPVILLPPGVDRVKLNFGATIITEHPFTQTAVLELLLAAEAMIASEERQLKSGAEPEDWDSEQNKGKYLKPLPTPGVASTQSAGARGGAEKRGGRSGNLVDVMCTAGHQERSETRMPTAVKSHVCVIL